MPAATKKRPPMEMEPGEGKAHESAESAAEETREGAEPDDAPKAKTNRKRSAKNAKATKAPMDGGMYGKKPMDGEGCNCGKRKAKCDGSCAKKMDRNDALTPQEYLAACDLGIQGRSRSYIRARLDAAQRLDLKCGNGSISEGEKCTKGTATKAKKYEPNFADRLNAGITGAASMYTGGMGLFNLGMAAQHKSAGHAIAGAGQLLGAGIGLRGSGEYMKGRKLSGDLHTLGGLGLAMGGESLGGAVAAADFRKRQANAATNKPYSGPDPFKELGLDKNATPAQARAAYLRQARQHHPDAGGDAAKFRQAKEAYEEIMRRSGRRDSIWAWGFDT
jgi:hypothetical protein